MSTSSPKSPKKSTTTISVTIAAEARQAYIQGLSLAEICRKFPDYTRDQFRTLYKNENWAEQKRSYEEELNTSLDTALEAAQTKLKRSILILADQVYEKTISGEIQIRSIKDVRSVCEIAGLLPEDTKIKPRKLEFTPDAMDRVLDALMRHKGIPSSPLPD